MIAAFFRTRLSLLAITGLAFSADAVAGQVPTTRARGDTADSASPCDTTAVAVDTWPEVSAGGLRMSFRMRMPPESVEVLQQSAGALTFAEFRAGSGDRSLTYQLLREDTGGVISGPQLSVARRCYRTVGPNVVQYWATRVGAVYLAGALWTWPGRSGGRSLRMHAAGPDSLWQGRALAAMRSVVVDTLGWRPPSRP
jgi:hypothetical protein